MTREYLKEEIRRVVKGRAATREEYTDTGRFERIGRGLSLKAPDRTLCWDLRNAWDEEMARESTEDFPDFVLRARDLARRQDPLYRCAVVDEAQDLTLVEMQFLRALVATVPLAGETSRSGDAGALPADALTVLDDSAQRIYPGGFKPRWETSIIETAQTRWVTITGTRRESSRRLVLFAGPWFFAVQTTMTAPSMPLKCPGARVPGRVLYR